MKSSPSAPAAPDPTATASAQSSSNIATAIANARLNHQNQSTPWGSISYTAGPVDSTGVPTYSSQITLSPQQQALLDAQQSQQLQRSQMGSSLLNNVSTKPLDFSHLNPMVSRGVSYNGAVNATPPAPQAQASQAQAPQGQSQQPQMTSQDVQALIAQLVQQMGGQGGGGASGQSPAASTPASASPAPGAQSTPSSVSQFMNGAPALGSSGIDVMNALAQQRSGGTNGQIDPRLSQFYDVSTQGSESPQTVFTPKAGSPVDVQGALNNGDVQVGNVPDDGRIQNRALLSNNPQFGATTPGSNVKVPSSALDNLMPYLMAAGLGGPAIGAAMGGAGAGASSGAGMGEGWSGAGADPSMIGGTASATPAASAGNFAPVSNASAALPGTSATATNPSLFAGIGNQMGSNLMSGSGLLGTGSPRSTALSALISLLRQQPQGQGGGK